MLELHTTAGPTGRLLKELLQQKHLLDGRVKGIVNYGYHQDGRGLPTLNAKAGTKNKYEELVALDDAGVTTVPFSRSVLDLCAPILGRRYHHTQGNDILVYRVRPLLRGDRLSDFYTELIEKEKEYRVWAFRNKFLACYEKQKLYPAKKRGRHPAIWNWGNGYAYKFVQPESVPARAKALGINAIKAMSLDFGAVDLLQGQDGHFYVLEVNSAPGTQGEARQGITSLVNNIERWAKDGFPERE